MEKLTKQERIERVRDKERRKKERRQKRAKEQQEFRDSLTPVQQIERLDKRLGVNKGAKKERARLSPTPQTV